MTVSIVPIKDIVTFKGGGTPSKSISEYWDGDIPWATVKDFKSKRLTKTQDHISLAGLKSSSTNLIPKGHVIIPTRMALGKAAINTIDLAINQDLRALIPKIKIHTEYLLYAVLSLAEEIEKRGSGATVKGITQENLYNLQIRLPNFDDQIRIATLLSRVEALIATRKDNLRLLDEFLKATFLEMFGDPLINEKGFKIRTLSEFYIDSKNGTKCGPFGSALKKEAYVSTGIPVWNMDNISNDGRLQPNVNLWITPDKYQELKGYSAINGDVIISRAGTVGKMCVLNSQFPDSIISTNLIRVRFGSNLLPLYFVSLMTYFKERVGRLKTGEDGTFTHMNTGILDNLRFPYPPISFQNQFAAIVEKTESLKTLYQQNLTELENLYAALSQKAFKGELDLSRVP